MEDVYTIKVKTKPDTRNLYPSERRYSASTVSGLAWVHIALAATSFLLACLAMVNPNSSIKRLTLNDTEQTAVDSGESLFNLTEYDAYNDTENVVDVKRSDNNYILVLAPTLLTIFALAAGIASIMASVRWYIDRNITWLFIMSVLSTLFALVSLILIAVWFSTTDEDISDFYKDKIPFKDFFVVKTTDVVDRNGSHMIIAKSSTNDNEDNSQMFTKRVLSINILIASFLELLWSVLSVKISFKGMRSNYRDDNERQGNCISVVTTVKGNNTSKLPRNGKLLPPKPIEYPSSKIKRIFLAQNDNGFYLKNQNNKTKQTETSSEYYKERMMSFLNRCASLDNVSNPDRTPSVQSEALNPIQEVAITQVEINTDPIVKTPELNRITPISWGDTPDHTVYNQNNINFEKIFNFGGKKDEKIQDGVEESDSDEENANN